MENTMEDSIRLKSLKEKSDSLKYPTKPSLSETKVLGIAHKPPRKARTARETSRKRSSSVSERFERPIKDKYDYVKPKTMTRVPSATSRAPDECLDSSMLNSSDAIRQSIYNEWYVKKLAEARAKLRDAQLRNKDEEEKIAQEKIDKIQKAKLIFDAWSMEKEKHLREKRRAMLEMMKKKEEEKESVEEKKKTADKLFQDWLEKKARDKAISEAEKAKLKRSEQKKTAKSRAGSSKSSSKKAGTPPLPFNAWCKQKEEELNERAKSEAEKRKQRAAERQNRLKKRALAEQAYQEWLDKKENQLERDALNRSRIGSANLNRSLSASMNSIPFYPASKTIPFGK